MAKITIPISGIIANFELENESNVTPKTLKKSLDAANGKDVLITINSPGGRVDSGLEMFSLIQNYPGNTETRIVSLAASMGSVLALAGNEKTAENTAIYFVHNAQGIGFGDYRDLAKESEWLKDISILIANLYAEFTTLNLKEARDFMDDDSHFLGNDLELLGFDIIQTGNNPDACIARVNAKRRFEEVKNKISREDYFDGLEKAVACIDYEFKKHKEQSKILDIIFRKATDQRDITKATTPADAGENNREVMNMTFEEFLAQNPTAKIEFDTKIEQAKKAGAEVVENRIKVAAPYLKSDTEYPDSYRELAAKVALGECSEDALIAAITHYDAMKESVNSEAAKKETEEQGDTPAGSGGEGAEAEAAYQEKKKRIGG